MPSSIKLKAELGDDFNVLYVESQGTSPDDTEAFIYRQRWGGSENLWTNESPCDSGSEGLPSFVLLGNRGQVLVTGYPAESKMKDLIAAEIKAAKSAPKDLPAALGKATVDFNKGNFAAAILAAQKLAQTPPADDKDGIVERSNQAIAEWTARAGARVDRLKYMLDNALFARADAEVLKLKAALKGLPDLEARLTELADRLASDEHKTAREAAKSLDNVLGKINEKGVDDKAVKELKKLAEKYPGTRPGDRAARLSRLLEKKPVQ